MGGRVLIRRLTTRGTKSSKTCTHSRQLCKTLQEAQSKEKKVPRRLQAFSEKTRFNFLETMEMNPPFSSNEVANACAPHVRIFVLAKGSRIQS
jgi:hypothetical protein